MAKKPTLAAIAPPPRDRAPAVPATSTRDEAARVPVNVRITEDRAAYLRMLAAKTGQKQYALIERAIDMLRAEAGEV